MLNYKMVSMFCFPIAIFGIVSSLVSDMGGIAWLQYPSGDAICVNTEFAFSRMLSWLYLHVSNASLSVFVSWSLQNQIWNLRLQIWDFVPNRSASLLTHTGIHISSHISSLSTACCASLSSHWSRGTEVSEERQREGGSLYFVFTCVFEDTLH